MIKPESFTLLAFLFCSCSLLADPGSDQQSIENQLQDLRNTRQSIQSVMAGQSGDEALQRSGEQAITALTNWEQELQRSLEKDEHRDNSALVDSQMPGQDESPLDNVLAGLDSWNLNENSVSFSVVHADWTIDEVFPGTKLIFTGQYSLMRGRGKARVRDCDCPPAPVPHKMMGTVYTHLQWGKGDSGLEYGMLSVTGVSWQTNHEIRTKQFKPLRDTLEIGALRVAKDQPLGVESYLELTLAKLGRTWHWLPAESRWMFAAGLGLSAGFAWAESENEMYNDVSNPVIGNWLTAAFTHDRWGKIYLEQRVKNGFTLSSPSAGGSVSREARFRAGYLNTIKGCLGYELYVDKRSFNFSDHRLDDLYTKSKRTGIEVSCTW